MSLKGFYRFRLMIALYRVFGKLSVKDWLWVEEGFECSYREKGGKQGSFY